jgi:hypothetical protein
MGVDVATDGGQLVLVAAGTIKRGVGHGSTSGMDADGTAMHATIGGGCVEVVQPVAWFGAILAMSGGPWHARASTHARLGLTTPRAT